MIPTGALFPWRRAGTAKRDNRAVRARARFVSLLVAIVPLAAWPDPASMPLLGDASLHLYTQPAYERFDAATETAVQTRYDELIAAGMDTARHLFDWRDLEPSPGVYDTRLVIDAMDALTARGIEHQFVNLVVIDSGGPVVPAYVEDLLAEGAGWDDPRISGPFIDLMNLFVPLMLERNLFMLGLSNEPGAYYEDEPAVATTFRGFVSAAIAAAHDIEPNLSTTVVFAGPRDPSIPDLLSLGDVATFNTYIYRTETDPSCRLDGEPLELFRSDTADRVENYLDELIAVAQGKLVNIQEIGQASAGATLGPATSEANQARVYEALVAALDVRRDKIRTVCNWTLNDHRDAWAPLADGLVEEGLPGCAARNVADIFTETGLVRSDAEASTKPAFDAFRDGISLLAEFSINQGIAGTWFNPSTPGQGLFVDIQPEDRLIVVSWSTFEAAENTAGATGEQRWYTAQGKFSGKSANGLTLWRTTGGLLNDPRPVTTERVGELSLVFDDCTRGEVSYAFDDGASASEIPVRRLFSAAQALCESLAGKPTGTASE